MSTENTENKVEETTVAEETNIATDTASAEEKNEEKPTEKKSKDGKIYPKVIPGATVRIHEKILEKKGQEVKERIQIFEGIVLYRKHGNQPGATITVRKIAKGNFGVEKVYPLHSPIIKEIEVVKQAVVKRAKLGFLKTYKKKLKIKKD